MIAKRARGRGEPVLVTFELPASIWAEKISLVGDFNDWNPSTHPLVQSSANENWHITVALNPNRTYRFRYLIDGQRWSNDPQADAYESTEEGAPCSVVVTGQASKSALAAAA